MSFAAVLALAATCAPQEARVPAFRDVSVDEAIAGAVDWLVENQREDGSFGSHHSPRPIEVLCDVPGSHHAFRVATTALCLMGLRDAAPDDERARAACDRAVDYLLSDYEVRRVDFMEHYHVWGLGYALQALGQELVERPDDPRADRTREVCRELTRDLERAQALDGGWGYLSLDGARTKRPSWTSMSFTTATLMIGLFRCTQAGLATEPVKVDKALDSIARCRMPTGAYTYGEMWNRMPIGSVNHLKGAACRTPACQHALVLFEREVREEDRTRALQDLLVRYARFQVAGLRRPIPHESWYGISGYFYLYGHAYAAREMEQFAAQDQRRLAPLLARAVLVCRQPDGSFWDYPLYSYHKPYGTGYALIALARVRAALEEADPEAEAPRPAVPTPAAAETAAARGE